MCENHYAILASVSEYPTFTNCKISITLLFSNMSWKEFSQSNGKDIQYN